MRKRNTKRGSIAIVMVLITLAILSTLVIEIMYKSKVSASIVTNRRDGGKAYELARSAVRWSIFRLQLDNVMDLVPKIPGTNFGGKKDDYLEFQWAVPFPYPFPVSDASGSAPISDIGGSFLSSITDESAKINLNDVGAQYFSGQVAWSYAAEVLENLLLSPRFRPFFKNKDHRELLWAIDDWIDADSEVNHTGGGMEDIEYQTNDRNLHVKNNRFFSVEELRLLKPMTDELFRELKPFVTVYPFDAKIPKMSSSASIPMGFLNVNTMPLELIAATFSRKAMGEWKDRLNCAQQVVKYRKTTSFGTKDEYLNAVRQLCGIDPTGSGGGNPLYPQNSTNILSTRSDTFSVEATGSVENITKTIRAIVSRDPRLQRPKILYWKVI